MLCPVQDVEDLQSSRQTLDIAQAYPSLIGAALHDSSRPSSKSMCIEGADFTPQAALAAGGAFYSTWEMLANMTANQDPNPLEITFIDARLTSGLLNQSKGFINFG